MKTKRLLDSFAMLAFLNGKAGCGRVREALAEARETSVDLLMNDLNVGETYYILSRKRGTDKADYFLETILPGLPIRRLPNDFDQVIAAARLKAVHPLSYADCFAVATARQEGSTILTGNPEFKSVEHLVSIEWLGSPAGHPP
jgi:predicted nucleic acid-binding protein